MKILTLFVFCYRRFGYPNREALAEGKTGIECRGEEHEVVIVWSVTSGKRQIMMDGKEVHYSMNRTGVLDHSWTARGNHILKVQCHAAAPMTANPNFRQYDLFIDGQSFFLMPKVYELGLRGGSRGAPPPSAGYGSGAPSFAAPAANIRAPRDPTEEEEELQRAINASIQESKQHLGENRSAPGPAPAAPPTPSGDLLSMDGPSSPGFDTMSFSSAPPPSQTQYGAPAQYAQQPPPPQHPYGQQPPPPQYGQPPPPSPQYGQQPPTTPTYPSSNAGASSFPALPPSNSYSSPPQQQQPPPQQAYGAPPPAAAYGQPQPPPQQYAPPPQQYAPAPSPYAAAPVGTQSYSGADQFGLQSGMDDPFAPKPPSHNDIATEILSAYSATSPTSTAGPGQSFDSPGTQNGGTPQANGGNNYMNTMALVEVKEEEPSNPFDAALKKLVNFDHIDEPAEEQLKLTMKKKEDETVKKNMGKSRGLPPVAKGQVGSQATLSQISSVKTAKEKRQDVMNQPPQPWHPDAAAAGMMVVHGAPQNGPPPLQPQGFGSGYRNAPNMQQQGYGGYGGYR